MDIAFLVESGQAISDWHYLRDELDAQFDARLHVLMLRVLGDLDGAASVALLWSPDEGTTKYLLKRDTGALTYVSDDPDPFDGQGWMLSPHWFASLIRVGGHIAVAVLDSGGALDAVASDTTLTLSAELA